MWVKRKRCKIFVFPFEHNFFLKTVRKHSSCCNFVNSTHTGDDCPPVWGQCGHSLHFQCVIKWLESQQNARQECPLCRQIWQFRQWNKSKRILNKIRVEVSLCLIYSNSWWCQLRFDWDRMIGNVMRYGCCRWSYSMFQSELYLLSTISTVRDSWSHSTVMVLNSDGTWVSFTREQSMKFIKAHMCSTCYCTYILM